MIFEDSRYMLADLIYDADTGHTYTGMRSRFFFEEVEGMIPHTVEEGDTLHSLAQEYFDGLGLLAAAYWWVIGDFQPEPILDPTVALQPGEVVYVPPQYVVQRYLSNIPDVLPDL